MATVVDTNFKVYIFFKANNDSDCNINCTSLDNNKFIHTCQYIWSFNLYCAISIAAPFSSWFHTCVYSVTLKTLKIIKKKRIMCLLLCAWDLVARPDARTSRGWSGAGCENNVGTYWRISKRVMDEVLLWAAEKFALLAKYWKCGTVRRN
jgi:hypothetical protein